MCHATLHSSLNHPRGQTCTTWVSKVWLLGLFPLGWDNCFAAYYIDNVSHSIVSEPTSIVHVCKGMEQHPKVFQYILFQALDSLRVWRATISYADQLLWCILSLGAHYDAIISSALAVLVRIWKTNYGVCGLTMKHCLDHMSVNPQLEISVHTYIPKYFAYLFPDCCHRQVT